MNYINKIGILFTGYTIVLFIFVSLILFYDYRKYKNNSKLNKLDKRIISLLSIIYLVLAFVFFIFRIVYKYKLGDNL